MKNLLLSSSLILIASFANAQNRGGRNVSLAVQTNVNYNTNVSNVYSNVATYNNKPSNISNRGVSNPINVNGLDNNINVQQRSNNVVRTRPANVQSRNFRNNEVNDVVILRGNRAADINVQLNDNNEQNVAEINFVQRAVNVDQGVVNVVPEVQKQNEVQVKEVAAEKPEVSFSPALDIDINLPKPNITFDLKVKEEKEVKEKVSVVKVKSGGGIAKVKKRTKSRRNNRPSRHQYSQKVKFGTVLRNTVSTIKHKFKKTKTKKGVFSVVCYKF
jgi:hypothetical protein